MVLALLTLWLLLGVHNVYVSGEEHKRKSAERTNIRVRNVVLMGQFNYDSGDGDPAKVLHWVKRWQEVFQTVVVAGPFARATVQSLREHMVSFYVGGDDKGYYSPVSNLARVLQDYSSTAGIDGVLYLHDDAILDMKKLMNGDSSFPVSNIMVTFDWAQPGWFKVFKDHRISNQREGVFHQSWPEWFKAANRRDPPAIFQALPNPENMTRNTFMGKTHAWKWKGICADGASRALLDPSSQEYQEDDGSIVFPFGGQSDFAFVPIAAANTFVDAAKWLVRSELFLECALPKLVSIVIKRTKGIAVREVGLCTGWGATTRGDPHKMVTECTASKKDNQEQVENYILYHPIKLKMHAMAHRWDQWFDYIVHGVGPMPK